MAITYARFETWADAVNHVREHGSIFYHAPLDPRPVRVAASVSGKAPRRIRLTPSPSAADPFWIGADHLDRLQHTDLSKRDIVTLTFRTPKLLREWRMFAADHPEQFGFAVSEGGGWQLPPRKALPRFLEVLRAYEGVVTP